MTRGITCNITVDTEGRITTRNLENTIYYSYNQEGQQTAKRVVLADGTETAYTYSHPEDGNVISVLPTGVTSHSKTDSFGRKVFDELQLGTGFVSRQFSYHAGAETEEHRTNGKLKSTATTQLVSQIQFADGRTLSYEYDAEERITKVIEKANGVETVTEYTYDAMGQLLTETVNNQPVNTMTYDTYGNILSQNGKVYTYGDDNWKDLLTTYDGTEITYDAGGNPLSYRGYTFTWEKGRQLQSAVGNDKTLSYTYNANGIRTSKTVNGELHNYLLEGTKILRETCLEPNGETVKHVLDFLYDNEDSICGLTYNGTPYYFYKNLQGDVIAITDANGIVKASYSYDAWGVCTVTKDESDCQIATVNPLRYRGYYMDVETGMYYLQSRYYDAEVGRFVNCDEPMYVTAMLEGSFLNLYTYCDNQPSFDTDNDGCLSFGQLKEAIKNIANNIKTFFLNIIDYVKKKFQSFISKTSSRLNNGYLKIKTAYVGYFIDAVITTIMGVVKGAALNFGLKFFQMWWKVRKATALREFIKNTVIPMLKNIDWVIRTFLEFLKRRFALKLAITISKGKMENSILAGFVAWRWISAFSSIGSFIAAILDILDGRFDDVLSI